MKKQRPDNDETIHVASSGDMTGLVPTPQRDAGETDAYATLGAVPRVRRKPGADRCGGGRG